VELVSRHPEEETGFRLRVAGGEREGLERAARTPGTTLGVRRLFFNTPARERFMRAGREEMMEIARVVTRYAASRHEIGFRLVRDGEEALNLAPEESLEARWRSLYGSDVTRSLVGVDIVEEGVRVRGAVSAPQSSRGNAAEMHLFVNGRMVTDRGLSGAILAAYHGLLSPRRYPRAILLLELPSEQVDVNVHPAKKEVRLARRQAVQDAVRHGVARALSRHLVPGTAAMPALETRSSYASGASTAGREDSRGETAGRLGAPPPAEAALFEQDGMPPATAAGAARVAEGFPLQLDGTFILLADADSLHLYDQHAAHERILFEDAMRRLEARRGEAQELLIPTVLTLTPDEEEGLAILGPSLEALGFSIAPFGARTIAVSSHPSVLRRWDGGAALRQMLADGAAGGGAGDHQVASTYACRSAVKAGDALTRAEMLALVAALRRAREPQYCPHGRPTRLTITASELRRRFRRE
jgi:DNA mismatch repair protein MutL